MNTKNASKTVQPPQPQMSSNSRCCPFVRRARAQMRMSCALMRHMHVYKCMRHECSASLIFAIADWRVREHCDHGGNGGDGPAAAAAASAASVPSPSAHQIPNYHEPIDSRYHCNSFDENFIFGQKWGLRVATHLQYTFL